VKEFRCASLGFHCSWRHIGSDRVLADMAVLHLCDVHGFQASDAALLRKIKRSFSRPLPPGVAPAVMPGLKEYICDLRPDCGWRYIAMTEDLIADGTAVHAREAHGIRRFTPQMTAHVQRSIHKWIGPRGRKVA
jgi:predicted small metal-binding protein